MEPLTISQADLSPFQIPFLKPFNVAGTPVVERSGFYLTLKTSDGLSAQGEAAPLEGISRETLRHVRHELAEICPYLTGSKITCRKDELLGFLKDSCVLNACASVRFAVESAVFMLASRAAKKSLAQFLGAGLKDVATAVLLQGSHAQVIADTKYFLQQGAQVFKLKVGDRNVALDVKKVNDIRALLGREAHLRLDGNRRWTLKEACLFAQMAGHEKIDFIEEPVNDVSQLDAFYQQARMPVALDETLTVVRSGIRAPGRCSPPLASQEGVVAYVLKPMVLGFVPTLDWIEEARCSKRAAVISSAFESPAGFKVLANLACLTDTVAGLGTERWFKNPQPMVGENGIIRKESLM